MKGRLRAFSNDSERFRLLQRGPTFRSRFQIYRSRIGVDSGFLPTFFAPSLVCGVATTVYSAFNLGIISATSNTS